MDAKRFFIFFILIIAFIVCIFAFRNKSAKIEDIILNGKIFSVEIADTVALRERGLSGHTPLRNDSGMLFIFPKSDVYGFWMKDMTFDLDIIWIDSNFKVVHIEKNLSPNSYPNVYYPTAESLYVLEISAGQADLLNIKIGDVVKSIKN